MMNAAQLEQLIETEHISLLSFDVFDTLITRPFGKPADLFCYMRDSSPQVPRNFPECRIHAEQLARQKAPGKECNMDEIYNVLAAVKGYPPELCRLLCSMEKETELRVCKPRPEGAALLRAAEEWEIRVILISDMYLSRRRISRMLCKCGLKNFAELYISSEHRRNKANGDLFRYVRAKEELPFRTMLHIGDNPVSDVLIPRNLGMHAVYLPLRADASEPKEEGILNHLLPHGTRRRKAVSDIKQCLKGNSLSR